MSETLDASLESFDYFDALFRHTQQNTVLLMDANGIIIEINTAFTTLFGYNNEDIIGKSLKILFTEKDQQQGLPEKEIQNVLRYGQSADNNYLVQKNKTLTWVCGESILVKNKQGDISILKVIQDIREQKILDNFLLRANDFNESILQSIEDFVIVINEEMKVLKANKAFTMLFKSDESDYTTINFADLIKPYDVNGDLLNKIQNLFKDKTFLVKNEIEIKTISGDDKVFDITAKAMEPDGIKKNVLLVAHDITLRYKVERQREDIVGFVAHELRNPLANIVLCNELMGQTIIENNSADTIDLLKRSMNNVMRLNKMVADLYDATRVSSGNLKIEKAIFNFEDMIREAIDTVKVLQPVYNIIVNGNANILVNGDRYRLIQVVTNYLSNGIKYSEGNKNVEITIHYDDESITVAVKDAGLGISKAQLPFVFHRFFRAEKTKNLEGIGLGLYLCQQIIKAHRGKVWVESEEGKGSTFYFSIPR